MTSQIDLALAQIHPGMTISLGGGNHMQMLADAIHDAKIVNLTLTTPSEETADYVRSLGMAIDDHANNIDIAFDGCDSADYHGNLLKSNGAIFTYEKRNALLAQQFVILAPAAKRTAQLDATVPLTVELLDAAEPLVRRIAHRYQLQATKRSAANYMGYTRTRDGNLLIDLTASDWSAVAGVDAALTALPGVVSTSFFNHLADAVITAQPDGTAQVLRKEA